MYSFPPFLVFSSYFGFYNFLEMCLEVLITFTETTHFYHAITTNAITNNILFLAPWCNQQHTNQIPHYCQSCTPQSQSPCNLRHQSQHHPRMHCMSGTSSLWRQGIQRLLCQSALQMEWGHNADGPCVLQFQCWKWWHYVNLLSCMRMNQEKISSRVWRDYCMVH